MVEGAFVIDMTKRWTGMGNSVNGSDDSWEKKTNKYQFY